MATFTPVQGDPFATKPIQHNGVTYTPVSGNPFGTKAKPKPSVAKDIGKSGLSGALETAIGFGSQILEGASPLLGGDVGRVTWNAGVQAGNRLGAALFGDKYQPVVAPTQVNVSRRPLSLPTGLGSAAGSDVGQKVAYKPQTLAGSITKTAVQMAPAALAPGTVAQKVANVVIPTAGSELAGQGARALGANENVEGLARLAGGLGGSLLASVRLGQQPEAALLRNQDPAAMRNKLSQFEEAGIRPTLADIVDESGRGVIRAAGVRQVPGRQSLKDYELGVRLDLPSRVATQAERISPESRNIAELRQGLAGQIEAAATAPEVQMGQSGQLVSSALNRRFDAAKSAVDAAYDAARSAAPEGAQLPMTQKPIVAANLREAVRDYAPEDIASITRELNKFDDLSALTARDLFEMRTRVGKLRAKLDPVEAGAAGSLVRAIDDQIAQNVEAGNFTGDPAVIDLWRQAIAQRREFGRQFEGGDLINDITARDFRGGQRVNRVAAEDVSNLIFGRNGVSPKPNAVRDLTRLRDTLGPNSPEWQAIQQEAVARILGRDAGREQFGVSLDRFTQQNPELSQLLITSAARNNVQASRGQIQNALGGQRALTTGENFLGAGGTDQFLADVSRLTPEQRGLALAAARRGVAEAAGSRTGNAPGVALQIANAPEQQTRSAALLGPEGANSLQNAMRLEAERLENARAIAPNIGSKTTPLAADVAQGLGQGVRTVGQVARGDIMGLLGTAVDFLKSRGMNDRQAQAIIEAAIDPARTAQILSMVEQRYGAAQARQLQQILAAALTTTGQQQQLQGPQQ